MRKIIFALSFMMSIELYAISIGDFTVKYEKNGKYYNFYDNPALLFKILNKKNLLNDIGTGYSESYYFDDCNFDVLSREFGRGTVKFTSGTINDLINNFGISDANHYFAIDYFEAKQNFSTIRDVAIGDDITKVLEKYPEATLYKNNGKYKWEVSDCYHESKIKKIKKNTDIGYILLETVNWQYNRSFEANVPMHYELVFVIKDSKVKSIVMQYVLDAM